jgi:hypothetical protein
MGRKLMGSQGYPLPLDNGHPAVIVEKPSGELVVATYPEGLNPEAIKASWEGRVPNEWGLLEVSPGNRETVYALCDEVTKLRQLVRDQERQIVNFRAGHRGDVRVIEP